MLEQIKVLDKGFVRLVDYYGDDQRIVDAARTSYKKGTKRAGKDEDLIRYLVRHQHTGPLEQCEVTYHMKLPLFTTAQLVRHRTFSFNFESLRYSEASDDVYIPSEKEITFQDSLNRQGGGNDQCTLNNIPNPDDYVDAGFGLGEFYTGFELSKEFKSSLELSQSYYKKFVKSNIRRELSRVVLPVAQYTECYAKVDLNNLFKFFKLRLDPHAQTEIRQYAQAMYSLAKPHYPIVFSAFEDYILNAITFSKAELDCLKDFIDDYSKTIPDEIIEKSQLGKREKQEFKGKLNKILS